MIIKYSDLIDKLRQIRSGKIKKGLKLDIPEIDEYFRFKPANFNVILGHANVGKTTTMLYLMLMYSVKHNVRWLIYSSENEPYTLIRKLVEYLEGTILEKISDDHFTKRTQWVDSHFKFIDTNKLYSYKELLSLASAYKDAWDYHGFMIDPYNSLVRDKETPKSINGHEYDYLATSEMRVFCKTKQVSIWLATHASSNALKTKHSDRHDYAGHPIPPLAADVEGGGKFVNRCDDFLVFHRYIQHPTEWMYSLLHIRKVKDTDTGGRPTSIDSPIRLKSVRNNVGFEINQKNLLDLPKRVQTDIPF